MAFTKQPERPQLTDSVAEQLPACMIPAALEKYYDQLPTFIDRMPTSDLIARAKDPTHEDNVLSPWERGYEDAATQRVVYGSLEPHAANYAQLSRYGSDKEKLSLVRKGFFEVVLPHVDPKVQTEIRTTLFNRAVAVAEPRTPDEIFTTFLDHLSAYDPIDLEHAWHLSNALFRKYADTKPHRSAPIVRERLYEAFVAVGAHSGRELTIPYSVSGVRTSLQVAKVGIVHNELHADLQKAGAFGRIPDLGVFKRKYGPLFDRLDHRMPLIEQSITPTNTRLIVGAARESLVSIGKASEAAARVAKDRVDVAPQTILNVGVATGVGISLLMGTPGSAQAAPQAETRVSLQLPENPSIDLTSSAQTVAYSAAPSMFQERSVVTPEIVYDARAEKALNAMIAAYEKRGDMPSVRATESLRFFMRHGLPLHQALGPVGNFGTESAGTYNPHTHQQNNGPGRGIGQWEVGGRWDTLLKFAHNRGLDPYALSTQLDYTMHEFNSSEAAAFAKLQQATSVNEAVDVFAKYDERPGVMHLHSREHYGQKYYAVFMRQYEHATVGTTSSSVPAPPHVTAKIVASPTILAAAPALYGTLHAGDGTPEVSVGLTLDGSGDSSGNGAPVSAQVVNSLLGRLGVETSTDTTPSADSLLVNPVTGSAQHPNSTPIEASVALSALPPVLLASVHSHPDAPQPTPPAASLLVTPPDAGTPATSPDPNSSPSAASSPDMIGSPSVQSSPDSLGTASTPQSPDSSGATSTTPTTPATPAGGAPTTPADASPASSATTPPAETATPSSGPSTSDLMQAFMNADTPPAAPADNAPVPVDLSTPTDAKQGTVDVPLNQSPDTSASTTSPAQDPSNQTASTTSTAQAPNTQTPAATTPAQDQNAPTTPPSSTAQTPDTQPATNNVPAAQQATTPSSQPAATPAPAPAASNTDSVEQLRQAEIKRLETSGAFQDSQALSGAPRTPLEKKLKQDGERNGRLHDVVRLGDQWGNASLYGPAAEQFRKMNEAFKAARGHDLVVNDSYRNYDNQLKTKMDAIKKGRPQFAATPGYSKHGWGLAIDLGGGLQSFNSDDYAWMKAHALDFGFDHPDFADDPGTPEPWHWEYVLSE